MPRGRDAKYLRRMKREMTSDNTKRFQSKTLQQKNKGKRITRKDICENELQVEDYLKVFQEMSKMANKRSDKEADRFCKKLGQELEL